MRIKSRKWLIRNLDKLIADRAKRMAGKYCDFCHLRGKPREPVTDCFHFLSRAHFSSRWVSGNTWASCSGCNIRYEQDADFVPKIIQWYQDKWGQECWDKICRLYHEAQPFTTVMLRELWENLSHD